RRPRLLQQRMRLEQNEIRQRDGGAEVGEVTAHASAQLPGSRVASAPETGEDLSPDRVVPVAEGAPDNHGVRAERPAPQHLVLRAEEDPGGIRIGKGGEARIAVKVAQGPLPDVTDELLHAER